MIDNINELLEKAKYDYKRFENSGQLYQQYALFDLFNNMNCIFDWFVNSDVSENEKHTCITRFNPYRNDNDIPQKIKVYYKNFPFPALNKNQYIIRVLCNLNKHFIFQRIYVVKEDSFYPGPDVFPGMTDSPFARNATIFNGVDENNESHQLDKVIEASITDWDCFLSELNRP
jgi:hypothetical protein